MAVIINPRGTSGAGKTEFARRIMARYGWRTGAGARSGRSILRPGRRLPIGYLLRHPEGGRPLAVLGHYEATSGGCDTIRLADGGMDEAFRLAGEFVAGGHDVLLEGLRLSSEYDRSARLAQSHDLRVLRLATPLAACVRNLVSRQRARTSTHRRIAMAAASHDKEVRIACDRLRWCAKVEIVGFDEAVGMAERLLGLTRRSTAA